MTLVKNTAPLECTYFLDILSQWCFIAEEALAKLRAKYADRCSVSYRFVPIAFKEALPVTRAEQAMVYERSTMITGTKTMPWIVEGEPTYTWQANATVLAAARLGLDVERVRAEIARAALLGGEPMGREGAAIALIARSFGIDARELETVVRSEGVAREMQAHEDEFRALGLCVRPTFVLRNEIDDHAVLGGAYRFPVLDLCAQSLLDDAAGYDRFAEQLARR